MSSLAVGDMVGEWLKSSDEVVFLMIAPIVLERSLGEVAKTASRVLIEGGEVLIEGRTMAMGLLAGFGSADCERARSGSPDSIDVESGIMRDPSSGSISQRNWVGR